jgi:hypothetical protein
LRSKWSTFVRGSAFRREEVIRSFRSAGFCVTLHPRGTFYESGEEEELEISVPLDSDQSREGFGFLVDNVLASLPDSGYRRDGGVLPG